MTRLEPAGGGVRRRWMRSLGAPVCLALLTAGAAGCGEDAAVPPQAAQWHDCDNEAYSDADGRLARVEVAGQDGPVVVKLVAGTGPCGGGLVARYDDGVAGQDVSDLQLDAETAEVVRLEDGQTLLRLDGAEHPRGGFQPHLFAVADGMAEVRAGGAPLLPFVATDGGAAPSAVRCGPGGTIEVLRATTSKPPGVVLAWDVHLTTYEIDGADATESGTEQIRDHAADPLLHKEMPALFRPGGLLDDCED